MNVELVLDLLSLLRKLMSDASLPLHSLLHCVQAAFKTLSGQGEAVVLDSREFYTTVYGIIPQLSSSTELSCIPILLECLDLMFLRRRQVSIERVASFVKRLSTLCLCVPPAFSAALLHFVHALLNRYPQVRQLFDDEPSASCGAFRDDIDDPDHANGRASAAWELTLLAVGV